MLGKFPETASRRAARPASNPAPLGVETFIEAFGPRRPSYPNLSPPSNLLRGDASASRHVRGSMLKRAPASDDVRPALRARTSSIQPNAIRAGAQASKPFVPAASATSLDHIVRSIDLEGQRAFVTALQSDDAVRLRSCCRVLRNVVDFHMTRVHITVAEPGADAPGSRAPGRHLRLLTATRALTISGEDLRPLPSLAVEMARVSVGGEAGADPGRPTRSQLALQPLTCLEELTLTHRLVKGCGGAGGGAVTTVEVVPDSIRGSTDGATAAAAASDSLATANAAAAAAARRLPRHLVLNCASGFALSHAHQDLESDPDQHQHPAGLPPAVAAALMGLRWRRGGIDARSRGRSRRLPLDLVAAALATWPPGALQSVTLLPGADRDWRSEGDTDLTLCVGSLDVDGKARRLLRLLLQSGTAATAAAHTTTMCEAVAEVLPRLLRLLPCGWFLYVGRGSEQELAQCLEVAAAAAASSGDPRAHDSRLRYSGAVWMAVLPEHRRQGVCVEGVFAGRLECVGEGRCCNGDGDLDLDAALNLDFPMMMAAAGGLDDNDVWGAAAADGDGDEVAVGGGSVDLMDVDDG
eukprot:XP_001698109.1 predicted protein [Chlamydomonas reinhardtii]